MPAPLPAFLPEVVRRLQAVPGVLGVALGGSHATGTATPHSDVDLSVAYDGTLDLDALGALCRALDDTHEAQPSPVGGWGPWVDGGAWLTIQGARVDVIYRDLPRVRQSVRDALAGRVALHAQAGHPHGIHAHHYAAELACCVLLSDPDGQLAALQRQVATYPPALSAAMQSHYRWMKGFWLDAAAKGLKKGDRHYARGCTYAAVHALAEELCARHGVWLLNEKGALTRAAALPGAPHDLEARAEAALGALDLPALHALLAAPEGA